MTEVSGTPLCFVGVNCLAESNSGKCFWLMKSTLPKERRYRKFYKNAPVPDEHFFSYRVPSRILEVPEDWRILEFCQFLENLRESWIFHRIEYIRNDMCSFLQQHCTDRFWLQSFAPPRPPPIKLRVSTVLLSQIGTFSDCNGKCENQMEIKCRKEYLIIMSTKGALSIAPHGNLLRIPSLPY